MAQLTVDTQPSVWASGPSTDEGQIVFSRSDDKGGFFGTTPIAQPTITVANSGAGTSGAILVALGLARQIP